MRVKKVYVIRIPPGENMVKYLERYAEEHDIRCASVRAIGALKNAVIGYFSAEKGEYIKKGVNEQCELLSAIGNISWKEEKDPFLHMHVVLGKKDFSTLGGHLIRGEVFVAEVIIHEYDSRCPRVRFNSLYLWETP